MGKAVPGKKGEKKRKYENRRAVLKDFEIVDTATFPSPQRTAEDVFLGGEMSDEEEEVLEDLKEDLGENFPIPQEVAESGGGGNVNKELKGELQSKPEEKKPTDLGMLDYNAKSNVTKQLAEPKLEKKEPPDFGMIDYIDKVDMIESKGDQGKDCDMTGHNVRADHQTVKQAIVKGVAHGQGVEQHFYA